MKNEVLEPLWAEEEEQLSLPQDVIDDLLNDVHDSGEGEEDGDCILQNGIDDTLDSMIWTRLKSRRTTQEHFQLIL